LEEQVFIVKTYWITGSIKNCQRRFVEPAVETLHSTFSEKAYLIFSCYQLPFCELPKYTTALHYRYDMQMYGTFVLFVNQYFPGLSESGTHCTIRIEAVKRHDYSPDNMKQTNISGESMRMFII
jgi:hypothetical protein